MLIYILGTEQWSYARFYPLSTTEIFLQSHKFILWITPGFVYLSYQYWSWKSEEYNEHQYHVICSGKTYFQAAILYNSNSFLMVMWNAYSVAHRTMYTSVGLLMVMVFYKWLDSCHNQPYSFCDHGHEEIMSGALELGRIHISFLKYVWWIHHFSTIRMLSIPI